MAITDETIEYVAALAKLDLTDEEKERAKKDLGNIIGYVDTMNQLDTTGIEPMSHVFAYHNVFRDGPCDKRNRTETIFWPMPLKRKTAVSKCRERLNSEERNRWRSQH